VAERPPDPDLDRDFARANGWDREYEAFDRSLDVQISRLRKMIEADPSNYLGTDGIWAPQWGLWFSSGGKQGKEPPADHPIRKVWDAWKAATSAKTVDEERKAIQQIVTIHKENVWVIGLVGETPSFGVVSNHMHNVPDNLISDEAFREEGFGQPAQYFLDNPQ